MSNSDQQPQKSQPPKKHFTDPADYDGMGDFSRYRTMKDRGFTSLENDIKNWLNNAFSSVSARNRG